jgi:hypothetical protein
MALPLSPSERYLAHQMLGITTQELIEIERAPDAEDLLKKFKARTRKRFRELALEYHPDHSGEGSDKAQIFSLLVRAMKWLDARQVGAGLEPELPQGPKYRVNTVTVPASGTQPYTRANTRRPRGRGDSREQAARLGKMRP